MKKLLLIYLLIPFISFGQKVEIINNSALTMSIPYNKKDNPNVKVITSIDTLKDWYSFNAIDWIYNDNNELWVRVECWDWSTAECCDCSPTKRKEGWVIKENIFAPSLFSEILQPFTLDMIDDYEITLKNKSRREIDIAYGWYAEGYGGVLLLDMGEGLVNIKGKLTRLKHISSPIYPNKSNIDFIPYHSYKSDEIELRIYEDIKLIEVHYQDKIERILMTNLVWEYDEYGY